MTPEFLNNEIFLELLKTIVACGIALFIFVFFVATLGGLKNQYRYKKCPICGKDISSELTTCRSCEWKD